MSKKSYEDMTVEELRAEAVEQDVPGRSSMTTRDQLIKGLSDHKGSDASTKSESVKDSSGIKWENDPKPPKTNEETRQFQKAPGARAWLTKSQAEKEGFFWSDKPAIEKQVAGVKDK